MRTSSKRLRTAALAVAACFALAGGSSTLGQEYQCLVEPYREVNVSSAVAGVLDEVLVDRGSRVSKGDVIATLVSEVERANLDLARARVEFALRNVERNEELYRRQMISIHEKDELETQARLLQLEVREVEERLEQRTVRSPIDGIVVKRDYSAGEYVLEKEIVTIVQVDPLRVEVAVPVSLYGKIRKGMTGEVRWEGPSIGSRKATVTIVDPVVDAASGTIGIRLELPNPDGKLPAGTKCTVRFGG